MDINTTIIAIAEAILCSFLAGKDSVLGERV